MVEDIFKALGDPTRIRVMEMLAENGQMCVCKIMLELAMTQPAVSHHLATLKHAGLVNARKEGQWVHYSLRRSTLLEVVLPVVERLLEEHETIPTPVCECTTSSGIVD